MTNMIVDTRAEREKAAAAYRATVAELDAHDQQVAHTAASSALALRKAAEAEAAERAAIWNEFARDPLAQAQVAAADGMGEDAALLADLHKFETDRRELLARVDALRLRQSVVNARRDTAVRTLAQAFGAHGWGDYWAHQRGDAPPLDMALNKLLQIATGLFLQEPNISTENFPAASVANQANLHMMKLRSSADFAFRVNRSPTKPVRR
jgi:hypothetical protein